MESPYFYGIEECMSVQDSKTHLHTTILGICDITFVNSPEITDLRTR